jgi:DNA segregation ATPase FtsK/SpoIIIE, S-DNA-T family
MSSKTGLPRPFRRGTSPTHLRYSPSAVLSMYDPIHFGMDENGEDLMITLMYRNLLIGGEPGAGKSSLVNTIVGHGALSTDCDLWLFDGKLVELSLWKDIADRFVGNNIAAAIHALRCLQWEMDVRYLQLEAVRRRKIEPRDTLRIILAVIDELAYFSAVAGTKDDQEEFIKLLLDVVQRGRAVGIIVVAATQRPSAEIVPTKIRDIFGFRVAFRCTTDSSSDIILANGWAGEGYSARSIAPEAIGVGFALAEGGIPIRFKAGYLFDNDIESVVEYARILRCIPARENPYHVAA